MFLDQLKKKGLMETSSDLDRSILGLAGSMLEENSIQEDDLINYLSWLPFIGLILLIRSLVRGESISIDPQLYL